jgi:hypothetical protein
MDMFATGALATKVRDVYASPPADAQADADHDPHRGQHRDAGARVCVDGR